MLLRITESRKQNYFLENTALCSHGLYNCEYHRWTVLSSTKTTGYPKWLNQKQQALKLSKILENAWRALQLQILAIQTTKYRYGPHRVLLSKPLQKPQAEDIFHKCFGFLWDIRYMKFCISHLFFLLFSFPQRQFRNVHTLATLK